MSDLAGQARVKDVVFAASRLPRAQRLPYVNRILRDREDLRREVHSLLEWLDAEDSASPGASEVEAHHTERLLDRYRILQLIGEGGAGAVYRAHDELLDVPVAIKHGVARDARHRAALCREILMARSVHHPNVRQVYDAFVWRDELYIAMEYLEGCDLAARLRKEGALAHEEVATVALGVTAGLAAMHEAGIVHGDLKPENVVLDARGIARITDLGVAHRGCECPEPASTGGTPRYRAPELRVGAPPTSSSDVYALALLLRDLLLGRPSEPEAFDEHLLGVEALVPDVAPQLAEAIRRGLLPEAERPRHAGAVLEILRGRTRAPSTAFSRVRRLVTVLCCEIREVGNALSLERARAMRLFSEIARSHGGAPIQAWSASSWIALFGISDSSDRQDVRAVRAALEIRDRLLAASILPPAIALDTELTEVLFEDGSPMVGGSFRSLCERALQVDAGCIVVGDAIRTSIGERFALQPLAGGGLYEVLSEQRPMSADVALHPGRAAFVGRGREKQALFEAWETVCRTGRGAAVAICGPPGIGKTRLIGEFGQALREACRWIEVACPDEGAGPLALWREVVEQISGEQIQASGLAEHLLGPEVGEMLPRVRQACLIDALVAFLAALDTARPPVLVVEDIHWSDPASLEVLARVAADAESLNLLLLVSWRSGSPGIEIPPASAHLELGPLDAHDSGAMLVDLLTRTDARLQELVERTGGVPYFVEQLAASIRAGTAPAAIPPSLRGLLLSRLDRLGPWSDVARAASVVGRAFRRSMLASVAGLPPAALTSAIDALDAAGVIERVDSVREECYRFEHSLLCQAAYESTPLELKQSIHAACVAAISADERDSDAERSQELARHCEGAGRHADAITWWIEAARHAVARSASAAAIGYFERALALHPDPNRELEIRLELLQTEQDSLAFSSEGAAENAERTLELTDSVHEPAFSVALLALGRTYLARADTRLKLLGERMDPIAERSPDLPLRFSWFIQCGNRELLQARFRDAREWFLRGLEGMEATVRDGLGRAPSPDPRVFAHAGLTFLAAVQCRPELPFHAESALAISRERDDKPAVCFALVHLAQSYLVRREVDAALPLLAEADCLAEAHQMDNYRQMVALFRGCAEAQSGDADLAAFAIRSCLAARHAIRLSAFDGFGLSHLALAEERRGDDRASCEILERGLLLSATTLDRAWVAELTRQHAGMRARAGHATADVAAGYERAILLAQAQDAVTLELRARADLARWHPESGARTQARVALVALVERPGLDQRSTELLRARALLAAD
jgi:serine/threonine protein kinase